MRIAINTRFLLKDKMEGFGWYTFEITKRLVENHPEHDFYFFFDRPFNKEFIFGKNVTPIVLSPPARHPLLFILWFEWAVPRAFKKHKIDLFFSPDGYLSLRSKIRQIGTIHDINFEHFPKDLPWTARTYLRYFFPKFAKKASHLLTVSEYSKSDIVKTYGIDPNKISAIWNGANPTFVPLKEEDKAAVQNRITGGKPYFLFVGSLHPRKNLTRLLSAFQKLMHNFPEMPYDLVIVGAALWKDEHYEKMVNENTRKHIHFEGHVPLQELTKIAGAASVFVYVPYFEGFGIPLVEAMQCGVPIVSGNLSSLPEVAGDAALYCDPMSVDDIAEKLKRIADDGELRNSLSQKGLKRAKSFSWDEAAAKVWEVLIR